MTAEDGLAHGGAGSYLLAEADRVADAAGLWEPRRVVLGVPTAYHPHARPEAILSLLGLDGAGIAEATRRGLARRGRVEPAEATRSEQLTSSRQRQPGQNS